MANHTNGSGPRLNSMDNAGFESEASGRLQPTHTVEMGDLARLSQTQVTCQPDMCRAMAAAQREKDETKKIYHEASNPWHRYKTFFFVGTILAFIVWIISYLTLEYLNVL